MIKWFLELGKPHECLMFHHNSFALVNYSKVRGPLDLKLSPDLVLPHPDHKDQSLNVTQPKPLLFQINIMMLKLSNQCI